MKAGEKVLKIIYGLVRTDSSPVHLPVSSVTVAEAAGITVEEVQISCHVLESLGFLTRSDPGFSSSYYYITKLGMKEAQKPEMLLFLLASFSSNRKRAY